MNQNKNSLDNLKNRVMLKKNDARTTEIAKMGGLARQKKLRELKTQRELINNILLEKEPNKKTRYENIIEKAVLSLLKQDIDTKTIFKGLEYIAKINGEIDNYNLGLQEIIDTLQQENEKLKEQLDKKKDEIRKDFAAYYRQIKEFEEGNLESFTNNNTSPNTTSNNNLPNNNVELQQKQNTTTLADFI